MKLLFDNWPWCTRKHLIPLWVWSASQQRRDYTPTWTLTRKALNSCLFVTDRQEATSSKRRKLIWANDFLCFLCVLDLAWGEASRVFFFLFLRQGTVYFDFKQLCCYCAPASDSRSEDSLGDWRTRLWRMLNWQVTYSSVSDTSFERVGSQGIFIREIH